MSAVSQLDAAIASVKASAADVAHVPNVDPADLSSSIAALRELAWALDHHVVTVQRRYDDLAGVVRLDGDGDVDASIEMIALRLGDIAARLADVDAAFADAHDLASRLART